MYTNFYINRSLFCVSSIGYISKNVRKKVIYINFYFFLDALAKVNVGYKKKVVHTIFYINRSMFCVSSIKLYI